MQYQLCMNVDRDYKPMGFCSVETNQGLIVIAFKDSAKLQRYMFLVAKEATHPVVAVALEAESDDELIRQLKDNALDAEGVTVLVDSDPIVDVILASGDD